MKSAPIHFIIALVVFLAATAGYAFSYVAVAEESTESAGLASAIAAKTQTAERATAVASALTQLASDETEVSQYFVSETNIVSFLGGLQSLGQSLSSTVTVLSVSAGKSTTNPALAISLKIEGSFAAVVRTMGAIEFAPYDITVTNFALANNGKVSANDPAWSSTMVIAVGSTASSTASGTK